MDGHLAREGSHRGNDPPGRLVVRVDPDLEDLVPTFLENRRRDVVAIRRALAEGDFGAIQVLGHNMKGSGGGYGFQPITEIGLSLERAARDRAPGSLQESLAALADYLDRVHVVYE